MARELPARPAVTLEGSDRARMSRTERVKAESQGLFFVSEQGEVHGFREELDALTAGERPTLSDGARELSKFSGAYWQQLRDERGRKTGDQVFMVRIGNPAGGALSARQWCALDEAADRFGDGTLRVTSRQGIQYHRVPGTSLAPLVRHLNRHYRDRATLGACGDVNRNAMCSPIDGLEPIHDPRGAELAHAIAEELAPRTSAYFQIWLSDEEGHKLRPLDPAEPLYGPQYLPRKFKVGIGHPTDNSVDVLTQDVGFVPLVLAEPCDGSVFDFYTGGGLGLTHNNPRTAALLGIHLGRLRRDQVVAATRAVALLQKEHGERRDRRLARWKYTVRRLGVERVKRELRERFGLRIEDAEPQPLPPLELHLGWHAQRDGRSYFGLSIESGRMSGTLREAVRTAVERLGLSVRLTPQQDLLLCDAEDRAALDRILDDHGVPRPERISAVRRGAMACPAKPTCGLAMTDAERILPRYLDAIEAAGFGDVDALVRMTGCPNNCVRPPTAEIGIYGYGKHDHVILVGGARDGSRLARTLYSRVPEDRMIPVLVGLFRVISERNHARRPVGDFLAELEPTRLREWIGVEDGGRPAASPGDEAGNAG